MGWDGRVLGRAWKGEGGYQDTLYTCMKLPRIKNSSSICSTIIESGDHEIVGNSKTFLNTLGPKIHSKSMHNDFRVFLAVLAHVAVGTSL